MKVSFCTDLDKSVVVANCGKRGWTQVGPEDEWNIYWAGTQTCRSLFSVDSGYRMNDNQLVLIDPFFTANAARICFLGSLIIFLTITKFPEKTFWLKT